MEEETKSESSISPQSSSSTLHTSTPSNSSLSPSTPLTTPSPSKSFYSEKCVNVLPLSLIPSCIFNGSGGRSRQRHSKFNRAALMANCAIQSMNELFFGGPNSLSKQGNSFKFCVKSQLKENVKQRLLKLCLNVIRNAKSEDVEGHEQSIPPELPFVYLQEKDFCKISAIGAALPDDSIGATVNLINWLPDHLKELYSTREGGVLVFPPPTIGEIEKIPSVFAVDTSEYAPLLKRMKTAGMVKFTKSKPIVINGMFGVTKPDGSTRVIIDARRANLYFKTPAPAELPNPALLGDILINPDETLFGGKTDMSNMYHRIKLPKWLTPYFGLPGISSSELGLPGLPRMVYPQIKSMSMGWSHSVYVAQELHRSLIDEMELPSHVELSSSSLCEVNPSLHGFYVDDFFQLGVSDVIVNRNLKTYIAQAHKVGLPTKESKTVFATVDAPALKVLGVEITKGGIIQPPTFKLAALVKRTEKILNVKRCSSKVMSSIIGSWTWFLLIRRSVLSVLSHVYKFINQEFLFAAKFTKMVANELNMLINLSPFLFRNAKAPFGSTALAIDASNWGSGVVYTHISHSQAKQLYPERLYKGWYTNLERPTKGEIPKLSTPSYDFLTDSAWKTCISHKWKYFQHINLLEARALFESVLWYSRSTKNLGTRMVLFSDSMVVLGALLKGRSSSLRLLHIVRRISAVLLASDIFPVWFWTPTSINPADGPSRGIKFN